MIAMIHVCCQKVLWILKYDRSMIIDIGIIYIYTYIYIFRKWKTHHRRFQVDFNKRYIRLNNFTNIYIYAHTTLYYTFIDHNLYHYIHTGKCIGKHTLCRALHLIPHRVTADFRACENTRRPPEVLPFTIMRLKSRMVTLQLP